MIDKSHVFEVGQACVVRMGDGSFPAKIVKVARKLIYVQIRGGGLYKFYKEKRLPWGVHYGSSPNLLTVGESHRATQSERVRQLVRPFSSYTSSCDDLSSSTLGELVAMLERVTIEANENAKKR